MDVESITAQLRGMFREKGDSEYGGEPVTQREHALQCAELAEASGAPASLILAALVHDIGHMLHDLPDDAPDQGVDDHHEASGYHFLKTTFGPSVSQPVRQHVAAKRYLVSVDEEYKNQLSEPSMVSLELQGGLMSEEEIADFRASPYWQDSVKLRKWDDLAKVPGKATPSVEHFLSYVKQLDL